MTRDLMLAPVLAFVFTALTWLVPAHAQDTATPAPQSLEKQESASNGADTKPSKITVRSTPELKEDFVVGKIKSVESPTTNERLLRSTGILSRSELVEVEVLEGPHKGSTFLIHNEITDNPAFNIKVNPGKEVLLSVVQQGPSTEVNIADHHRLPALAIAAAVFLLAFVVFGGATGLRSLLGVGCAIGLVAFVLLPLSLKGYDPLVTAIGICILSAAATVLSVSGISRKSGAALCGTAGGVIIAGVASHLVITGAPLTGLSSEEAQILRGSVLSQPPEFFAGLLAAAMLIGALGVIMDVAISIASACSELAATDPGLDTRALYNKGMNVGRDIMGTMTSTLILAYAGGALPLLMLLANTPSVKLLNLDIVATEVAAALTGSLGLVCTVPLTAVVAAKLLAGKGGGRGGRSGGKSSTDPFSKLDSETRASSAERRISRRVPATYSR